ncbi:Bacteriophage/Gene transfer agent portal protein [Bartonella choladocola]|uniref:phage portal protein n=1 Tax=Bartonella choladocola TaxID=2750995 RepID=UPI00399804CA
MKIWPFSIKTQAIEQKSQITAPEDWLVELFQSSKSISGISVTPANAMRCTPVRAAIEAIAEPVGQLPLHVFKKNGDQRDRVIDHPVAKVLDFPNSWTTAQDLREQVQRDCLLYGNGYAEIIRVNGNKPQNLIRLNPASISIETDDFGEPIYLQGTGKSTGRTIKRENIIHIKTASLDGFKGVSPVNDCKNAIGVALALEKHAGYLFGRGARPSGALMFPKGMGEDAVKQTRKAWRETHESEGENGKTAILYDGVEFKPFTFTSVDAQFLETWRHAITEIARIFRVPPPMLYELGRATWGNAVELRENFLTFTLSRWLKAWQGELKLKLFTEDERANYYVEFETNDLLKTDLASRAASYATLISSRVMNPNECRARENLAPYEGGDEFINPNIATKPDGFLENTEKPSEADDEKEDQ